MTGERMALGGVLYVALDIVVGVMAGAPPSPAAPESEIVAYIAAIEPASPSGCGCSVSPRSRCCGGSAPSGSVWSVPRQVRRGSPSCH